MNFQEELGALINKHSLENESNTPDYVLATYLIKSLEAFNACIMLRDGWHGHSSIIGQKEAKKQDQEECHKRKPNLNYKEAQLYTYKQMEELCGEAKKQGKQEVLHLIRNDLKKSGESTKNNI